MNRKAPDPGRVSRRVAVVAWIVGSLVLWAIIGGAAVTAFQAGETLLSGVLGASEKDEDVLIKPAGR